MHSKVVARCIYNRSERASFIAEAPTFSKNAARVISQICVRAPIAKDTDTLGLTVGTNV